MSTNLSFLAQHINKIALVVILKVTKYFVVPFVNLLSTSNALHYHISQGTDNMSIHSLLVMLLKMTLMNIIVIFVKKNEIQNIGSIIVQIAVILLILIVFLADTQILGQEMFSHLTVTHTPLLSL